MYRTSIVEGVVYFCQVQTAGTVGGISKVWCVVSRYIRQGMLKVWCVSGRYKEC